MDSTVKSRASAMVLAFLTIVLWSSAFVFTKIALKWLTPETLGAVRYLIASLFLLVIAFVKRMRLPRLRDLPVIFASGLAGFAFYAYAFNMGSMRVTAATASILISTGPIFTAVLAALFYKERISPPCWLAIALQFAGIVIIALGGGELSLNWGILWMVLAALAIAVYNVLQRRLLKTYTTLEATTYSILSGTILMSYFLIDGIAQLKVAPILDIVNIAYLGIFPGAVGFLLWSKAISKAEKITTVTNFMFVTPLLSGILGVLIISELPTVATIVGGTVIIGGSLLYQWLARKQQPMLPNNKLEESPHANLR